MRWCIALAVSLAGTLVLGAPVGAATSRVTVVSASTSIANGVPVISGRINAAASLVRIEAYRSGRWVLVKKAPVSSRSYRTTLKTLSVATKYRAGVGGRYSRTVIVAAARPPSDACGTVLKKADGSAWACTFHDDFSGTTLDPTRWVAQTAFAMGTPAAHTCYRDDPSTIQVAGGSLNLSVRRLQEPVSCSFGDLTGPTHYVSGGVMTHRLFGQQFGRFEARIRTTATTYPGLHEAFWLWPDDRVPSTQIWPYAGEIDISETYSKYPGLSVPFLHYSADALGTLLGVNTAWNCVAQRGAWNTYTLVWTATKVQILVNGTTCLTNTSGDSAFLKPYILALTQGLGAAGNEYDGRAPVPATMNVDYVRVWK